MADVVPTNSLCASVATAVFPRGCSDVKTPNNKLANATAINSDSLPSQRIAKPKNKAPADAPSAFSNSAEEPSMTNSSRFELSAALAKDTAYKELPAAPKAAEHQSKVLCSVA